MKDEWKLADNEKAGEGEGRGGFYPEDLECTWAQRQDVLGRQLLLKEA